MNPLSPLLALKDAAIRAKGLAPKVWLHGTNKDVVPAARPLWLAEDPAVAALYSGGGRRAPVTKSRNAGRLIPFLTKDKVHDTGMVVTADVPTDTDAWLTALGIKRPEEFRRQVAERAEALARSSHERSSAELRAMGFEPGTEPLWDDLGAVGAKAKGAQWYWTPRQYEVLDRPAFREQLIETLGPDTLLQFSHPSSVLQYTKRGVPKVQPETIDASVLWAPSAKDSVVSPFELKRGGLVQMRNAK